MVMDQRKAILTQCAEAVEHRMKKDPLQREPSPAIRTFHDNVQFFILFYAVVNAVHQYDCVCSDAEPHRVEQRA